MRHWDKTDLENLLFYIAAKEKAEIFFSAGVFGILKKAGRWHLLERLGGVYNRFFQRANKRFLQYDTLCTHKQNKLFRERFLHERRLKILFRARVICMEEKFSAKNSPP